MRAYPMEVGMAHKSRQTRVNRNSTRFRLVNLVSLLSMKLDMETEDVQMALRLLDEKQIAANLNEVESRILRLERQAEGWRLMLKARRMLEDEEITESDTAPENVVALRVATPQRPGITEAILRVMETDPDREWRSSEIYESLSRNGWVPESANPRKTMGATLSRMAHKTRQIEKPRLDEAIYKIAKSKRKRTEGPDG
jgi:hypothetical protein